MVKSSLHQHGSDDLVMKYPIKANKNIINKKVTLDVVVVSIDSGFLFVCLFFFDQVYEIKKTIDKFFFFELIIIDIWYVYPNGIDETFK